MLNCKLAYTSTERNLIIEKSESCNSKIPYKQFIGSLMYFSVLTRPDNHFM